MPKVEVSLSFDAPLEAVGDLVGAFDLLADFHPQIAGCDADGHEVGARRTLWLSDGQSVEDTLVEVLSPGYVYEGVDSRHMTRWRGRIEVTPAAEQVTVTWTVDFDIKPGVDLDGITAQLRGVLEEGLAGASRQLAGLE